MTGRICACIAAIGSIVVVGLHARQQSAVAGLRYERLVESPGAGPQRLSVDVPLLVGTDPFEVTRRAGEAPPLAVNGLADLRFVDANGQVVPHILVHAPAIEPSWRPARLLEIASTKTTSGFEADAGSLGTGGAIAVTGLPAPFLKRFVLEGSGDRERWTMLAGEGTMFDLPAEGLKQTEVQFVPGAYRYFRVSWDDTNSGRMPMPAAVRIREVGSSLPRLTLASPLTVQKRPSEPGLSRYRLGLPGPRLPIVAVDLDVRAGHVLRSASVFEARVVGDEARPFELGRAMLKRVERNGATAAELRVPIAAPTESELELVVEDGSNPPLDLSGAVGALAELPWIYLESKGGPITAHFGNPNASPAAYDLEAVRESLNLATVPVARWKDVRPAPRTENAAVPDVPSEPGAALDPSAFSYTRPVPEGSSRLTALGLDAAALAHSRGPASRFADVRIVEDGNRQVPYLIERRDEPLSLDLTFGQVSPTAAELKSTAGHNRSTYKVTLPYDRLPDARLVLDTSARVFRRDVLLAIERPPDRRRRDAWVEIVGGGVWQHTEQDSAAPPLVLPLRSLDTTDLVVSIDEADNGPLPVTAVRLLLPSYRLRFYRPQEATLRLVYGSDTVAFPRYDLALLSTRVMGAQADEVQAGPESGGKPEVPTLVSPMVFWGLLGIAAIVLLGLIVRLVTAQQASASRSSGPRP